MKSKCKICRNPFNKTSITHRACSPDCAIILAAEDRVKKEKKANRERKIAIRSRSEWIKLAQFAFNMFIRKRDDKLPCVSCGRHHNGQYHAGHYLSTGACPELRFDEANCHKQCAPCNNHLSGNIVFYRGELIRKIGQEELDRLEGPHEPNKWTIYELKEIIKTYKAKVKELN